MIHFVSQSLHVTILELTSQANHGNVPLEIENMLLTSPSTLLPILKF